MMEFKLSGLGGLPLSQTLPVVLSYVRIINSGVPTTSWQGLSSGPLCPDYQLFLVSNIPRQISS